VLIVDFDVIARHEIAEYLRSCGFRVLEANGTDEAVVVLAHRDLPVDAVLCDAEAPGEMGSFALSRWARGHRAGIDFILAGNVERAAEAAGDLCDDLCDGGSALARPYDPSLVVDRIKRRLAERDRRREAGDDRGGDD
jgi:DNA-binding NtrC family response regulator